MNDKPIGAKKSSFDLVDTKRLFLELDLKEDTIFLDIACGNGAYSIAASKYIQEAGKIYAFDLWKEGIESLQNNIRSMPLNNFYAKIIDVSRHIPLEDLSVDVCLMATVLHDLIQAKTDMGTLKEIQRVLRPQGTLCIIEFNKIQGPPGPKIDIRLSPEELNKVLQVYSFYNAKTMEIGQFHYLSIFKKQEYS